MRACLVYIKIIPQKIFIAEFRELSKGQKISVSQEKNISLHDSNPWYFTKNYKHFVLDENYAGILNENWVLRSNVRFKKKKLKREVFSLMSEEISPLMCRRCGTHIIYYILSCYKFICQLHQVYMHAYLNLRSNMAVVACSLRSNITLRKLSFQGLFY